MSEKIPFGLETHSVCPKCKCKTVDPNDNECKNAYCEEDSMDNDFVVDDETMNEVDSILGITSNDSLVNSKEIKRSLVCDNKMTFNGFYKGTDRYGNHGYFEDYETSIGE